MQKVNVMTFDELKQIDSAARSAEYKASSAKSAAQQIGKIRRDSILELEDVKVPFETSWNSNRSLNDEAANAIKQATLDLLPDILRLAEMRLEAKHKHQSTLARAKNAQVADFLGGNHDNQD